MKKITDKETIDYIFSRWFIGGTRTNNYLLMDAYDSLINGSKLFYLNSDSNCCLLVEKDCFFRLYYFLNDFSEPLRIDVNLPVVIEIVYRGISHYPLKEISYWSNLGFEVHLTRDNYHRVLENIDFFVTFNNDIEIKYIADSIEIEFTKELLHKTLDRYTGDILSLDEIRRFVEKKWVLIAYFNGKRAGVLQFEIKNNVVWLGHLTTDPTFRGKGIANALMGKYLLTNFIERPTKYQLWVVNNNKSALSLYNKFGFSFANKCSTSLLKI